MSDVSTDVVIYNPPPAMSSSAHGATAADLFDDLPLKELVAAGDPTISSDTLPRYVTYLACWLLCLCVCVCVISPAS